MARRLDTLGRRREERIDSVFGPDPRVGLEEALAALEEELAALEEELGRSLSVDDETEDR